MYLTAQRVKPADGESEVHAFLHLHDREDCPFPDDRRQVALKAPGRLVTRWPTEPRVAPGGNDVVSYLDIAVQDYLWTVRWLEKTRELANMIPLDTESRSHQAWELG
ncbi:MAG: hypothetical protein ACHP9Z_34055, partial [Streptosporangiales bacterium]